MSLFYDLPNPERLAFQIEAKGMTSRQFSKQLYGNDTHRDVLDELEKRPNPRSNTLVKICRLLDISIDSLFQKSDSISVNPAKNGNTKEEKKDKLNEEIRVLKTENEALKMILAEKDNRINDLKKVNNELFTRFGHLLEVGSNKEKTEV